MHRRENPPVSKTLYCWGEGKGSLIHEDFPACAHAWHVSFLNREKKKDGWITRKLSRLLPLMEPLIWLLTRGDGSFVADLKACLICDSGCITQKGLIRNLIYVTAFNWNQIYRNWKNWLLFRFISRLGESKMMSREHKDWEGWIEKKIQSLLLFQCQCS